jgi:quinolinate synthase
MPTSLLMAVYSPESMITLIHVSLVWNSKKAMLDHYNKSNTSSTILPTEINLRATLYLKDSMKEMLRVKLLPKSSRLDQKSMKDGTIKTSMKDHIQTLDSTE